MEPHTGVRLYALCIISVKFINNTAFAKVEKSNFYPVFTPYRWLSSTLFQTKKIEDFPSPRSRATNNSIEFHLSASAKQTTQTKKISSTYRQLIYIQTLLIIRNNGKIALATCCTPKSPTF